MSGAPPHPQPLSLRERGDRVFEGFALSRGARGAEILGSSSLSLWERVVPRGTG